MHMSLSTYIGGTLALFPVGVQFSFNSTWNLSINKHTTAVEYGEQYTRL